MSSTAASWLAQARQKGSNVGVHVNVGQYSTNVMRALLQQMHRGLFEVGTGDVRATPSGTALPTMPMCLQHTSRGDLIW